MRAGLRIPDFRRGCARAVLVAALAAAGCSGYVALAPPGQSETEVLERFGEPSGRHRLDAGGMRLEYARGPFGQHTYMIDLDREGRVIRSSQVLGMKEFRRIVPGMPREELLREFGRPAERMAFRRLAVEVWSYRYPTYECQWFQVTLDRQGRVLETGYAPDPMCDVREPAPAK